MRRFLMPACLVAAVFAGAGLPHARADEGPERAEPPPPSPATVPATEPPAELPRWS